MRRAAAALVLAGLLGCASAPEQHTHVLEPGDESAAVVVPPSVWQYLGQLVLALIHSVRVNIDIAPEKEK